MQDFDHLWRRLKDNYAYFDKKETNWNRVKDVYRPKVAEIGDKREFVTLLERVLDELYDPHTHLKVKTNRSTRLIPTGLDVWAEWKNGKAIITQTPPSRHGRTRRLNENSAPGIYRSDACGQRPGNAASSRAGREPLPDRARCCS